MLLLVLLWAGKEKAIIRSPWSFLTVPHIPALPVSFRKLPSVLTLILPMQVFSRLRDALLELGSNTLLFSKNIGYGHVTLYLGKAILRAAWIVHITSSLLLFIELGMKLLRIVSIYECDYICLIY